MLKQLRGVLTPQDLSPSWEKSISGIPKLQQTKIRFVYAATTVQISACLRVTYSGSHTLVCVFGQHMLTEFKHVSHVTVKLKSVSLSLCCHSGYVQVRRPMTTHWSQLSPKPCQDEEH